MNKEYMKVCTKTLKGLLEIVGQKKKKLAITLTRQKMTYLLFKVWFGLVYWVLWHINLCRLFNAKSILCKYSFLFKTIQFSINIQFNCPKHFYFKLFKQLYVTIQLSVNTVLMSKNSSILNNSD